MHRKALCGAALVAALMAVWGCDAAPTDERASGRAPVSEAAVFEAPSLADPPQTGPTFALMTSLPLYWPLAADMTEIASGSAAMPWPRVFMERGFTIVPLDTLSPTLSPSGEAQGMNPLADIQRLAIIQPRGLSPADNVALDEWVRGGGRLLLALDPALTAHYEVPVGDPRLPTMTALIPPVVARWGLAIRFDEARQEPLGRAPFPGGGEALLRLHGEIAPAGLSANAVGDCAAAAPGLIVQCAVGKGQVTLIADAAMFEHRELAGATGERLRGLLSYAFDKAPTPAP
ncbi:MAG: hypothetical protein AAFZ11_02060 [Pseudomonadota bacterium]